VSGLHHVVVGWDIEARVRAVVAATWDGLANQLRFLGGWEFENYQP
jgi:hypothetical protein